MKTLAYCLRALYLALCRMCVHPMTQQAGNGLDDVVSLLQPFCKRLFN